MPGLQPRPGAGIRRVEFEPTFDSWRRLARQLVADQVPPAAIDWQPRGEVTQLTLGYPAPGPTEDRGDAALPTTKVETARSVPKAFLGQARKAALHRWPERWDLLYRVLWRLLHGEPHLMKVVVDEDVYRLQRMVKAVSRDLHKMKAFVRFRKVENDLGEEWFVAWHRPDHRIARAIAPFFVERFNDQRWMILTPDASASWNLEELSYGPGMPREAAPRGDELEKLWLTYYASIFNPARVKVKAMKAEMPVRHWATLPEAALIPELLLDARGRVDDMVARPQRPPARQFIPRQPTLASLGRALAGCRACVLCENGSRPVAGAGPAEARIVVVGEQPGDHEEESGRPFVGPAGQILDRALAAAGLDRSELYLTNTVKHFKFERQEKRRIHKTPGLVEVSSCLPWLREELELLRPQILVLLGATAARALLGGEVRLRRDRGQPRATRHAPWTLMTYHPAALLRIPDPAARQPVEEAFFADLQLVAQRQSELSSTGATARR